MSPNLIWGALNIINQFNLIKIVVVDSILHLGLIAWTGNTEAIQIVEQTILHMESITITGSMEVILRILTILLVIALGWHLATHLQETKTHHRTIISTIIANQIPRSIKIGWIRIKIVTMVIIREIHNRICLVMGKIMEIGKVSIILFRIMDKVKAVDQTAIAI